MSRPRAPRQRSPKIHPSREQMRALTLCALAAIAVLTAAGCGTGHPSAISARELSEAQTFPYYRVYWVGSDFEGHELTAADGRRGYNEKIGDSLYYGDCVKSKGIFGGGSCVLPLQVTTVVYRLHSNAPLGAQRNIVVRGVPATVYDEGRSMEIYSGRVAIDVFSNTFAHALAAANRLLPINAPGSSSGNLPPPVYCPGLSGAVDGQVAKVMAALPKRACQHDAAEEAFAEHLST